MKLRDLALRRLHEQALDVHERVADGEHEQIAAEALRPAAERTEEAELLLDRRIGVDASLGLERPGDLTVLREAEHAQLAVIGRVRTAGDPRDHVVAHTTGGRHRDEEDELLAIGIG